MRRVRASGAPSRMSAVEYNALAKPKKRPKYGNRKVAVAGETFDSKREAARWEKLCGWEQSGEISQLKRQVPFVLAPKVKLAGERRARPALRLVVDFTYWQDCQFVVEDVKGHETPASRIKRHLMKSVHGIDVRIVR